MLCSTYVKGSSKMGIKYNIIFPYCLVSVAILLVSLKKIITKCFCDNYNICLFHEINSLMTTSKCMCWFLVLSPWWYNILIFTCPSVFVGVCVYESLYVTYSPILTNDVLWGASGVCIILKNEVKISSII